MFDSLKMLKFISRIYVIFKRLNSISVQKKILRIFIKFSCTLDSILNQLSMGDAEKIKK